MRDDGGMRMDMPQEETSTPLADPAQDLAPELEPDHGADVVRRIPHLGHALLFVSFTGLILLLAELLLMLLGKSPAIATGHSVTIEHPKLQLAAMGVTYLLTLLGAWFFFPVVWKRAFLDGLEWRWPAARKQALRLIPLGFLLGALVQLVTRFIPMPKEVPIGGFFLTQSDAWLLTIFGSFIAPLFEEICFRGFLQPAFAIAYDWLSLEKTAAASNRWQTTTTLSTPALIFSAILSSVFFALLHAQQVAHAWGAIAVLFTVSLVLTFVRIRTRSVAASTLVHGAYNFFVFFTVLIATGGYRHLERMTQ